MWASQHFAPKIECVDMSLRQMPVGLREPALYLRTSGLLSSPIINYVTFALINLVADVISF